MFQNIGKMQSADWKKYILSTWINTPDKLNKDIVEGMHSLDW